MQFSSNLTHSHSLAWSIKGFIYLIWRAKIGIIWDLLWDGSRKEGARVTFRVNPQKGAAAEEPSPVSKHCIQRVHRARNGMSLLSQSCCCSYTWVRVRGGSWEHLAQTTSWFGRKSKQSKLLKQRPTKERKKGTQSTLSLSAPMCNVLLFSWPAGRLAGWLAGFAPHSNTPTLTAYFRSNETSGKKFSAASFFLLFFMFLHFFLSFFFYFTASFTIPILYHFYLCVFLCLSFVTPQTVSKTCIDVLFKRVTEVGNRVVR